MKIWRHFKNSIETFSKSSWRKEFEAMGGQLYHLGAHLEALDMGILIRGCVQRSLQQGGRGGLKGAKKCGRQSGEDRSM